MWECWFGCGERESKCKTVSNSTAFRERTCSYTSTSATSSANASVSSVLESPDASSFLPAAALAKLNVARTLGGGAALAGCALGDEGGWDVVGLAAEGSARGPRCVPVRDEVRDIVTWTRSLVCSRSRSSFSVTAASLAETSTGLRES